MTSTPLTRAIDRTTRAYAANAILNNYSACPNYTKVIDAQHSDQFWDVLQGYQEMHEFNHCLSC